MLFTHSCNYTDKIYALGGTGLNGSNFVSLASVEEYDKKNGWKMFKVPLGTPVASFSAGVLGA